jgi:hypothetical protein
VTVVVASIDDRWDRLPLPERSSEPADLDLADAVGLEPAPDGEPRPH